MMCVLCFAPSVLPPCSIPYARVCRVSQTKTIFSDHLRAFTEGCGCKPHIGPIVRGSSAACLFFCLWCGPGFAPAWHALPHPVAACHSGTACWIHSRCVATRDERPHPQVDAHWVSVHNRPRGGMSLHFCRDSRFTSSRFQSGVKCI
jgi:hypothetical protein